MQWALKDEALKYHMVQFLPAHEAMNLACVNREWWDALLTEKHAYVRWSIPNKHFRSLCYEACYLCDRVHEVGLVPFETCTSKKPDGTTFFARNLLCVDCYRVNV